MQVDLINSFITIYQDRVRKAKKKIAEENIQKAVKAATEVAKAAASERKAFCIAQVDVGLDTAAVREAVLKVLELQVFHLFIAFPSHAYDWKLL